MGSYIKGEFNLFYSISEVDSPKDWLVEEGVGDIAWPEQGSNCAEGLRSVDLRTPKELVLDTVKQVEIKYCLCAFYISQKLPIFFRGSTW